MDRLVPQLPPLPAPGQTPISAFPGQSQNRLFIRRTETGQRAQAVFVHGMGGNSTNWTDLMYLLAPTLPGIALDLPGYGFSDPTTDGKYSITRNALAVIEVIETQADQPVHLFGNSLGGVTAVAVAAMRPDLVKTMTLVSPAMLTRTTMARQHLPRLFDLLSAPLAAKRMNRRQLAVARTRSVYDLCYAQPDRIGSARFELAVAEVERRLALPYNQTVAIAMARALFEAAALKGPASIWSKARSVSAPTLNIYGTQDRLVPVELAPKAAAVFPHGQVVIFPDCGHVAQMEHPRLTARTALQWIAAVSPPHG